MLLSYVKVPATHYALHFQQGRIRREGLGLSFFYYAPSATIAAIPMGSTDAPLPLWKVPQTSSRRRSRAS
jgi:hypothetical protein